MKKSIYLIAILFVITMAISCKKDKAVSVTGFWTGTAQNDGSIDPESISFLFNSDNSVRAYLLSTDTTASLKGSGTYSIDADSVRTTIIIGSSTLKFNGKLNSANNQMNGRVANITSSLYGSYAITKN